MGRHERRRLAHGEPDADCQRNTTCRAGRLLQLPFTVVPGQAYHLWIRGKAQNDSWQNDSVYVQFSSSTASNGHRSHRHGYRDDVQSQAASGMGEVGWGWQDNGYGEVSPDIYFARPDHSHQAREDGLSIIESCSPVSVTTRPLESQRPRFSEVTAPRDTATTTTSGGTRPDESGQRQHLVHRAEEPGLRHML